MLKCTIELIPFGDESKKETLGELWITNDGGGTLELGNYIVTLNEKGHMMSAEIKNHPRLQHGPAFLVAKAIEACLSEEGK